MSDGTRVYEPPPGADEAVIDTHEVDFGSGDVRDRQRVSLAGTAANSDVAVMTTNPTNGEAGLVTRQAGIAKSQLVDSTGAPHTSANPVPVEIEGGIQIDQLTVAFNSRVSTINSTQTPLGANETFLGDWENVVDYGAILVTYYTDVDSAAFGAGIEFSIDGVNALPPPVSQYSSVPGGTPAYVQVQPNAKYVRVRYTNGPVAQTVLQSQVVYSFMANATTQSLLAAPGLDTTVVDQVKAVVAGRKDIGTYEAIGSTPTNELRVNDGVSAAYLNNRYGGGKSSWAGQVTLSGDTVLVTPATGKRIQVFWVYAIATPTQDAPLITFKLGSTPIYSGYALSHWESFTGAANEALAVNLSATCPVAVTVHYKEIT